MTARARPLLEEIDSRFGARWFTAAEVQPQIWYRRGFVKLVASGALDRRPLAQRDPRRLGGAEFEYRQRAS